MPSIIIHMAVAKKVAKSLDFDSKDFTIGSIAPDMSKIIGNERSYSHFCDEKYSPPNIDAFLYKYKDYLYKPFVLGYFVHLYTDYLFETYFQQKFLSSDRNLITKIDGSIFKCNDSIFKQYLYNDYTDLNKKIINKYKIDCSVFDETYDSNDATIEEISIDKVDLLLKTSKEIIDKSNEKKNFLIDIKDISSFIDFSTMIISQKIKDMNINIIKAQ